MSTKISAEQFFSIIGPRFVIKNVHGATQIETHWKRFRSDEIKLPLSVSMSLSLSLSVCLSRSELLYHYALEAVSLTDIIFWLVIVILYDSLTVGAMENNSIICSIQMICSNWIVIPDSIIYSTRMICSNWMVIPDSIICSIRRICSNTIAFPQASSHRSII